ncbi:MAG: hypothetical protein AAF530_23785 [Pseudomonadota bacterium]
MRKAAPMSPEQRFAASQKKGKPVFKERDKAQQEFEAKTARLRALRLAKEASEQDPGSPPSKKSS